MCQCECGGVSNVDAANLRSGGSTQCKSCDADSRCVDFTGKTIGRLTVLSKAEDRLHWNVVCSCGTTKVLSSADLSSKSVQSCGCSRLLRPFEALYNSFKGKVKAAGHSNSITFEQFLEFTEQDECHYCLAPIRWTKHFIHRNGSAYNLDRTDNTLGYSVENCVACCKRCNLAKREHYNYQEWWDMNEVFRDRRVPVEIAA
jgi:hypothetical protein